MEAQYFFLDEIPISYGLEDRRDVAFRLELQDGGQQVVFIKGLSSASLPYKVKISFTCTPKAGFTPQEGVDYDAILSLDYAVYAYDTNGDKMAGDTQQLKITHAEGLELVDHFDEIWAAYAEEFPFHRCHDYGYQKCRE